MVLAAVMLTGCGDDNPHFTLRCRIEGLGSQGVDMIYTDHRGVLRKVTSHPDSKGIVEFTGSSATPTLAELFTTGSGEPLLALPVKDGEKVEARMVMGQPLTLEVKGWKPAPAYAELAAAIDSLADPEERNRAVAKQVKEHPGDFLSALMLITRFHVPGHELEADSLLNLLLPEARPQGMMKNWAVPLGTQTSTGARGEMKNVSMVYGTDSVRRANLAPGLQSYGLLLVTSQTKKRDIVLALRSLRDSFPRSRLEILEASVNPDSATWRSSIARDTANWQQGWTPGGVSSAALRRLQIPRVPYYIVSDSTGRVMYRGDDFTAADSTIRICLGDTLQRPPSSQPEADPE